MTALPALSVVRGEPTAAELAAVIVALARRSPGPDPVPGSAPSTWSARSRLLRAPVQAGPGAWRASGLPR